jgi:hypothetical protein
MARKSKTRTILEEVGGEIKTNEPKIVGRTRRKFGAARASRQKTAILLDKARRRGAHIKRKSA